MARIAALQAKNRQLAERVVKLEEELALARLHRFAPRSEKHIDRLFNEAEQVADEADTDDEDPPRALPAPVPEADVPPEHPTPVLDGLNDRIEIASGSGVAVRLLSGSSAALIVAIATGMARRR